MKQHNKLFKLRTQMIEGCISYQFLRKREKELPEEKHRAVFQEHI
jgi:hypothetical protein